MDLACARTGFGFERSSFDLDGDMASSLNHRGFSLLLGFGVRSCVTPNLPAGPVNVKPGGRAVLLLVVGAEPGMPVRAFRRG